MSHEVRGCIYLFSLLEVDLFLFYSLATSYNYRVTCRVYRGYNCLENYPCHLWSTSQQGKTHDVFAAIRKNKQNSFRVLPLACRGRRLLSCFSISAGLASPLASSCFSLFFFPFLIAFFRSEGLSRWWFQTFFIFTPIWGNDPIWRAYFSDGWFNHQLVILRILMFTIFISFPWGWQSFQSNEVTSVLVRGLTIWFFGSWFVWVAASCLGTVEPGGNPSRIVKPGEVAPCCSRGYPWHRRITPPKTTEGTPENGGPLEKEIPNLETIISRFHVNFWGCILWKQFSPVQTVQEIPLFILTSMTVSEIEQWSKPLGVWFYTGLYYPIVE